MTSCLGVPGDGTGSRIVAVTSVTGKSFGERIEMDLTDAGTEKTRVRIERRP